MSGSRTWISTLQVHRARELVVRTPHGVRLSFSEPDRDSIAPAGVLIVDQGD